MTDLKTNLGITMVLSWNEIKDRALVFFGHNIIQKPQTGSNFCLNYMRNIRRGCLQGKDEEE